jgi:lysozyme family protein
MTILNKILDEIIDTEGGFVNNPIDRGGPTKYGITLRTLQSYKKGSTINDLKNIDTYLAKDIYYGEYLVMPRINELPEFIHHIMLDMSINHGARNAVKILQKSLRRYGYVTKPDGIIGSKTINLTIEACNNLKNNILVTLVYTRNNFYKNIVINDRSQKIFLKGWLNRSNKFMPDIKNVDKLVNKEIFRKRMEESFRDRTGEQSR